MNDNSIDDGLLAGPELESEAELIALGILKAPEPVPELVSFNIRDYLAMADETVIWQMPYLAPSGCITLLVGSPGAGKLRSFGPCYLRACNSVRCWVKRLCPDSRRRF